MIDGTAASRSTTKETGPDTRLCRYCVMQRATPTATGTAIAMARTADKTVVQNKPAIPKRSSSPATVQLREVRKLSCICLQAGKRKCQQKDADKKYEKNDQQTGCGCEAPEDPISGPADLGELDATRALAPRGRQAVAGAR